MEELSLINILIESFKIIFCTLICKTIYNWLKMRTYPPGPVGVPLLGYTPFLGNNPHLTMTNLAKKYGDIMSLNLEFSLLIVVNDYQLAKKLLNHPMALNKSSRAFDLLPGKGGIHGSNGKAWKEQRHFGMMALKDIGWGKGPWEMQCQKGARRFVEQLQKTNEEPFNFIKTLRLCSLNDLFTFLLARPIDEMSDEEKIEATWDVRKIFSALVSPENSSNIPQKWFLKVLTMLNYKQLNTFGTGTKIIDSFIRKEIYKRLESLHEAKHNDFISIYLRQMEEMKEKSKPNYFSIDFLVGSIFMFFQGGQESIAIMVSWMLLLITEYPEVQQRMQNEIEEFIGKNGIVYFDDQEKLVYTTAVIQEMMRYLSPLLLLPPRRVEETFVFEGYTIPKGSHITYNIWAANHDPRNFDDPWKFKPERFLTEDGTRLIKYSGLGTFSVGKRICAGERISKMSIYIYFLSVIQQFRISVPNGKKVDMSSDYGFSIQPMQQELCFQRKKL